MILAQIEDAAQQDREADGVGEDDAPLQGLGDEADERPGGQEIVEADTPCQRARGDRRDGAAGGDTASVNAQCAGWGAKARDAAFQRLPGTGGEPRAVSLDSHRVSWGSTPP
jgi:hypothetical protein